jgi:hypothetical protein
LKRPKSQNDLLPGPANQRGKWIGARDGLPNRVTARSFATDQTGKAKAGDSRLRKPRETGDRLLFLLRTWDVNFFHLNFQLSGQLLVFIKP